MPAQRDALTELLRQHVGEGRTWSTREFAARAVDPDTGWAPSKSLVAKILAGGGYTTSPQLISALAAGFDLPRTVVAAAAHYQVIGFEESELRTGAAAQLVHHIGKRPAATPRADAVAARWEAEANS